MSQPFITDLSQVCLECDKFKQACACQKPFFNYKNDGDRAEFIDVVLSLSKEENGMSWETLTQACENRWRVQSWAFIRRHVEFLLECGLIEYTDNSTMTNPIYKAKS